MENSAILRLAEVCHAVGLSSATIARLEQREQFPARRRLSPNTVGWLKTEIDQWVAERKEAVLDRRAQHQTNRHDRHKVTRSDGGDGRDGCGRPPNTPRQQPGEAS